MNGETKCVYIQCNIIIKMKEVLTHATIWMNLRPYAKIDSEVKVTHSCLTFCNPMDYTVHEILQARMLEWVPFPFSRESSQPRDRTQVSCITAEFFTSWATISKSQKDKYCVIVLIWDYWSSHINRNRKLKQWLPGAGERGDLGIV